jgi:hypothetical protein|tara:strand:- start:792 stop:980 length:189 start_codon:yes stop_codon:yes gene_type:complete
MAAGDITATTTEYSTMALLNTALDALSTGAATAGSDTTSYIITADGSRSGVFYLTKIVRAGS